MHHTAGTPFLASVERDLLSPDARNGVPTAMFTVKHYLRTPKKGHNSPLEGKTGYESDRNRRNGSRLFPAQRFEFLKIGINLPLTVKLIVVIEAKITENAA